MFGANLERAKRKVDMVDTSPDIRTPNNSTNSSEFCPVLMGG